MITCKSFTFNAFGVNAYVVYDDTNEAVIVDGAVNSDYEMQQLKRFVDGSMLKVKYIINTHGHLDHICGNDRLKVEYNVPVMANYKDTYLIQNVMDDANMFGFQMHPQELPDVNIVDGDEIRFGKSVLKVLEVPGHSQGSVALYSEEGAFVICGDALFRGSIGRTDMSGGSYEQLIESIKTKLFALDKDVVVLPGHGSDSSIGFEFRTNPFFNE